MPDAIEPKVVGWATPDDVVVSKSDMVSIITYVTALHDWIRAAAACLDERKTFGETLNAFLEGQ